MSSDKKDESSAVSDAEIIDAKGGGSNKLLLIVAPIVLIVGVIAGFFLTPMMKGLMGGDKHEKSEKSHEKKDEDQGEGDMPEKESGEHSSSKAPTDPKKVAFIPVPDVLVNLKGDRKSRPTFLKVSIVLQIHDGQHAKETIEPFIPKVVDQMQLFLRDLDINDVSGANNLQRLRRELLMRVNNVMAPHKVDDVLIKEFLIQ